jgi:hypothetical protein
MNSAIKYSFKNKMWKYSSQSGWYFISLPKKTSKEIRTSLKWQEEGWGRMKATAKIDEFEWKTSIWYDTKHETYLLPIKAEVRKKLKLEINKQIELSIFI